MYVLDSSDKTRIDESLSVLGKPISITPMTVEPCVIICLDLQDCSIVRPFLQSYFFLFLLLFIDLSVWLIFFLFVNLNF